MGTVAAGITLAATVLILGPGRDTNRYLALLLGVESGILLGQRLVAAVPNVSIDRGLDGVANFSLALGPSAYLLFMGSALDAPLARPFRTIPGRIVLWCIAGAAVGFMFLQPDAMATYSVGPDGGFVATAGWLNAILNILAGVAFLYAVVAAFSALRRQRPGTVGRRRARSYLMAFGVRDLLLGPTLILWNLPATIPMMDRLNANAPGDPVLWSACVFYVLASYAILRWQILGLELRVKQAVFVMVFLAEVAVGAILALTLLRAWMQPTAISAVLVLILVAGFYVWERRRAVGLAGKLADRLMPRVRGDATYASHRRLEIYRAALTEAGSPNPSDTDPQFLKDLRRRLGISNAEHRALWASQGEIAPEPEPDPRPVEAGDNRLHVYFRAVRREAAAGASTEELEARLRPLRAQLEVSDRDHAVVEYVVRSALNPAGGAGRALSSGDVFLHRYRVRRLLGEGGFGRTYLCHDTQAARDVVLKLMRSPTTAAEGLEVALAEARNVAAIRHPNVVTLFDVEIVGEEAFIVMELLEGGSLKDRLAAGRLSQEAFARLGADLLRALGAIHDAKLVHRDIKPSNILFDGDGRAKVADFGISRLAATYELTALGDGKETTTAGTIRYMSPEVARGRRATRTADLYSAAATLFEAHTGRPYLDAESGESGRELQRRAARPPPFPTKWPGSKALGEFFRQALDPDPARRFQSAADMEAALRVAVATQGGSSPQPARLPRSRRGRASPTPG